MTDQRSNLSKAFDPSVLMEAFAIEQALKLLIDWTCIEYVNRFDSEDYETDQTQFVKVSFGGLIDERLRDTDVWRDNPYRYDLVVPVYGGFEDINDLACLLSVVTTDYDETRSEGTVEVAQFSLLLGRFKHLYPFLISDAPQKVLKILTPCRATEGFF